MNKLINYLKNLNSYIDNLNKEDILIQYKIVINDQIFKLILLWKNKQFKFYQLNEFICNKDINNIVISDLFDNGYYIVYINYLITLINEDILLNHLIKNQYFTFPIFSTRTDLSKYYSKLTSQDKKEIYKKLKEKITY